MAFVRLRDSGGSRCAGAKSGRVIGLAVCSYQNMSSLNPVFDDGLMPVSPDDNNSGLQLCHLLYSSVPDHRASSLPRRAACV
jgi:hypothetical protein